MDGATFTVTVALPDEVPVQLASLTPVTVKVMLEDGLTERMTGDVMTLVWVTPSDQVTVQGAVPVRAAWMLVLAPEQIVPPPLTVAVGNGLTTWASTDEVLLLKLVLPLYVAVSEFV